MIIITCYCCYSYSTKILKEKTMKDAKNKVRDLYNEKEIEDIEVYEAHKIDWEVSVKISGNKMAHL